MTRKDAGRDANGLDSLRRANELTLAGRTALAQGDARRALQVLREKHNIVVATFGKDAVFSATSAVDLAEACLAGGDVPEANRLLEWAIQRYSALGIDDARFLRAKSSLAMCAYQLADYRLAESRFVELINHYKTMGSDHDVQRAMMMDHLAQVYLRQSRNEAAEPLLLEALAIFERDGSDSSTIVVCLGLLASLRFKASRFREAEQLQRRVIAIHKAADDHMNLAKGLDHLGTSLAMRAQSENRPDLAAEAVTYGQQAVAIFEKYLPANHYSLLGSKQNLSRYKSLAASIGKWLPTQSDSADDSALPVPAGHEHAIRNMLNRSFQLCQSHEYDGALAVARDTHKQVIRYFGGESPLVSEAIANIIGILRRHCSYLLGEPTGQLSPFESLGMQMRAHARRGLVEDEITAVPNIEPNKRAAIEGLVEEALKIVGELLNSSWSDLRKRGWTYTLQNAEFGSNVLEVLHYARWLHVLDSSDAAGIAFEIIQLHGGSGAGQALATAVRQPEESYATRRLREDYRLTVLERDTLIRSLVEAKDQAAAKAAAVRSTDLPMLERKLAALERQLQEKGPADLQSRSKVLLLPDAQSALETNEAVVAIYVGRRAIFLIAVRRGGTVFKRVEIEDGLVRVMCEQVVKSATLIGGKEPPQFDLLNAFQIHGLIFDPLRDFLKPTSHLLVIPDGPLWTLPLGCLVANSIAKHVDERPSAEVCEAHEADEAEQNVGDEQVVGFSKWQRRVIRFREWLETQSVNDALLAVSEARAWLSDKYRISLMPSLEPLKVRGRRVHPSDKRRPFLGIGDPIIPSSAGSRHVAVPETRRILTDLAVALGGDPLRDVVVGNAATIDRLVDLSKSGELGARRVLCFATHAIYPRGDGDLLIEGGLLLSQGGVLTAFDVAGLRINADFVLLTACFTGSPSGRSITVPLSGLAQAFLAAGARGLLVSHWPVEVRATELFVKAFANAIGQKVPLAGALAAAEEEVRNSSREYAHPAFWAGFSMIGDGAADLSSDQ